MNDFAPKVDQHTYRPVNLLETNLICRVFYFVPSMPVRLRYILLLNSLQSELKIDFDQGAAKISGVKVGGQENICKFSRHRVLNINI